MAKEISGMGGGQPLPQIKRVSVRSNAPGHANAGVSTGAVALPKVSIKDTVTISPQASGAAKPAR